MPQLELTELELKALWLLLDRVGDPPALPGPGLLHAEAAVFEKVYRAYRGMPPRAA